MIKRIEIRTSSRVQLLDITPQIKNVLSSEDIISGIAFVYVPHTTCGITINENADPGVRRDIISTLERLVPEGSDYNHLEGNADAHIKASLIGSSITLFVENGTPVLGTWQGIFLAEFDGPRQRSILVKIVST
ncbi:MAG: YjbQ family protein [Deltaproteobacteria bacterium]|nr:MAG: YjbQ family protein [Deltaproteobacteria bacterium]